MATITLIPPLVPRDGKTLKVLCIDRISTKNQDPKSKDDQDAQNHQWIEDRYDDYVEWTRVTGTGSGESLDRDDVYQVIDYVKTRKFDVTIMEDLGRHLRRFQAFELCELCEDTETRLIAINDHIDTVQDWRINAFFAVMKHEQSNKDTSLRIKRTLCNRFINGGVLRTPIYGIIKPVGAQNESELYIDPVALEIYDTWFTMLEQGATYSEVADWLNYKGIPTGPSCKLKKWDCAMVARITRNPMLKGNRERNRKVSKRLNSTGHYRSVDADPGDLLLRHCSHLVIIDPERFDRVNRMLRERNKCYSRNLINGCDPLKGKPKKRTMFPGQSVFCGICGRLYVYGGHGKTDRLMCSGAREYKCWNGVTFSGELVRKKMAPLIMAEIENLPVFESEYRDTLRDEVSILEQQQNSRHQHLNQEEQKLTREIENITSAIKESCGNSLLYAELGKLDVKKSALQLQRDELNQHPVSQINIPDLETVKQMAREQFNSMAADSPEFARLMKRLIPQFFVYPYRLIDGGHPVLRATVTFSAASLVTPGGENLASLSGRLTKQWQFDLFEPPQREEFRVQVMELTENSRLTERDIAQQLGITQPAVQYAKKLARLKKAKGIQDVYQPLQNLPDNYKKMRRCRHNRFQFEPLEGYPLVLPAE